MSDFAWLILLCAVFLITGAAFIPLGWKIAKKQRMDLIIRWHCEEVSEEKQNRLLHACWSWNAHYGCWLYRVRIMCSTSSVRFKSYSNDSWIGSGDGAAGIGRHPVQSLTKRIIDITWRNKDG